MLTQNYIDRFGGVGRLYGIEALTQFSKSHVMIIGLGGVGSWTVECLARSGVGQLTLVDLDDICVTNTNRQLPATTGNYGKMKAEALRSRVVEINPECLVKANLAFYSERNSEELLSSKPTLVIDAIDSVKAKCHLLATCCDLNLKTISCGGAGGRMDTTKIKVSDLAFCEGDKLASSVRRILRKDYGFPSGEGKKKRKFKIPTVYSNEEMIQPKQCETAPKSRNLNCATGYGAVSHITATFGNVMAQLALQHIAESITPQG